MANLDAILKITAKGDASGLAGLNAGIKGIQKAGEQANSALGGMGNILGGLTGGVLALGAGLSAAGLAAFAKGAIDAADNLRDLSQKTGVSVENLSRFQQAAEKSGTTVEGVGNAMVKLSRGMAAAAETGKGPAAEALQTLGISAVDASGKLRGVDQVMLEVSDRFQGIRDGARQADLAVKLFGKAGADMVPMLNEGRQAIEGLAATMSTEFANKADAYNDSLAATRAVFGQIGMAIADQLLPYLSSAVDWISRVGIGFRDYIVANKEPIQQTIETIGRVGAALAPWVMGLGVVAGAYAALTAAIKGAAIAQAVLKGLMGDWKTVILAAGIGTAAYFGLQKALEGANKEAAAAALEAQKLAAEMGNAATAAGGVEPPIDNAKAKQEAFKAAVQQTNAEYQLMAATIDATSQAIQRQGQLRDAALSADIAVNNAAKSILEYKLSQARTDADKIPILLEIKQIEMENARLQKEALDAQIIQETEIINLKRQKAWEELRSAQRTLDTANAMGEQTARLQEQVRLMQVAANSADTEYRIQQKIAAEKARGNQATYSAQQQIIGMGINQIQNQGANARPTGRTFNGRPTYMENGREMGAFTTNGVVQYKPISFAGGGYTGNAPRSGGLDGRGGFWAMVHPRETIIDHTRAAAGGGGVPTGITIPIQTGPVYQLPDGTDTVSMADFQSGMQTLADGILGALRTPGGRIAMRGS
jgi:hypothetical protein